MTRMRIIKPDFFTDDELADVSIEARMLFIGLWCIADREGRFEDRPRKIKAEILPFDDLDVNELLQVLHDGGFIVRYEVAGRRYGRVRSFLKHQRPHHKEVESFIPPPANVESNMNQAWANNGVSMPTQASNHPSGGNVAPIRGTVWEQEQDQDQDQEGEGTLNAVALYEEVFGFAVPNKTVLNGLLAFEETHSAECIRHCLEVAAEADIRDWRYSKKILERHAEEGCGDLKVAGEPFVPAPWIPTPEEQAELDADAAKSAELLARLESKLPKRTA